MTTTDPKLLPEKTSPAEGGPAAAPVPSQNGHAGDTHPHLLPAAPTGKGSPIVSTLIWIVVLAGLVVVGYFAWRYWESAQKPPASAGKGKGAIPVVVEKSHIGDMPIYIDRVGTVEAYNSVTLRTRVDGQLDKVDFTEGQTVHQNDILFEIDPRPFQVQLMQAQGQLAKDEATLANARVDLARFEEAKEAISKQVLDTARAAVASDEGIVKADQGAIEAAKLNIVYCTIRAPITGRIGFRMVDQGNMVHSGDANGLAVIDQLQPIAVIFSPTQEDLPRVTKAMARTSRLPVEAWNKDNTRLIASGTLEALENQIDPTTGTFKAKAVFANDDISLYPNQFVNVRLLVDTLHDVVLVPDNAIQQSPTSAFVYVVKPDKSVDMREVKTGPSEKGLTVITTGLEDGAEVVTAGVDKLEPGTKVTTHAPDEAQTQPEAATAPANPSAPGPSPAHAGKRGGAGGGGAGGAAGGRKKS